MVEVLIYGKVNRHFTYRTLIVNIYIFLKRLTINMNKMHIVMKKVRCYP